MSLNLGHAKGVIIMIKFHFFSICFKKKKTTSLFTSYVR